MVFGLGIWEILLLVAVVLLLFGTKRIPALVRALGEGISNFRRGLRGDRELGEVRSKRVDSADTSLPRHRDN
jgi:sec-independent protein translocase protein TatA